MGSFTSSTTVYPLDMAGHNTGHDESKIEPEPGQG